MLSTTVSLQLGNHGTNGAECCWTA